MQNNPGSLKSGLQTRVEEKYSQMTPEELQRANAVNLRILAINSETTTAHVASIKSTVQFFLILTLLSLGIGIIMAVMAS